MQLKGGAFKAAAATGIPEVYGTPASLQARARQAL